MQSDDRLRLLSYAVIFYMLLAFTWWSVLLYNKNEDAFLAKKELLKRIMLEEGQLSDAADFLQTDRYQTLEQKYKRQEWMIFGEAGVFVITLLIGLWLINRGYHKQIRASKQQRNFLLSITHELKSPIAAIRLVLETIHRRELPPDTAKNISEKGLRDTDRLNNLVNNLLLAARMETTYQPVFDTLSLPRFLYQLLEDSRNLFPEANIQLHTEELPKEITADRLGLYSLLSNLIENAVKYSPSPAYVDINVANRNNNIQFSVCDRGIGIPNREKKQIFEKFYRLGNENTRKTKGTGLGLFIVKNIANAHRASIDVIDNKPRGTCFRIVFPLEQPKRS